MVKVKRAAQAGINLGELVRKRAYELYQRRKGNAGNDWQDWFEAEKQIKQELGIVK